MAEIKHISDEINQEIAGLAKQGLALLGLSEAHPPADIVAAITKFVRERKAVLESLADEQIYALGALLGCQYVRGLNWHWASVVWDGNEENGAIGVLNSNNSLFNNPIGWVSNIIEADGGVPFLLSYNMIIANQAPIFAPNSATAIY